MENSLRLSRPSFIFLIKFSAYLGKVENILKGKMVWSHHLHLQCKFKLWAGQFAWGIKAKIADHCQHPAMFCLHTFPTHNLISKWDRIQAIFLNFFYFSLKIWMIYLAKYPPRHCAHEEWVPSWSRDDGIESKLSS